MNKDITFRPVCEEDLSYRMKWLDDSDLRIQIEYDGENTLESNRDWLTACEGKDREFLSIILDSQPIGLVGLKNISEERKDAEVFIMIGVPEWRNRGIGELAMVYLLSVASRLKLEKLFLSVNKENIPAIKLYKKTGFKVDSQDGNELFMTKVL